MKTVDRIRFLGADHKVEDSGIVLMGAPFDGTASFRPGARFGPDAVRIWSDVLETYSPVFERNLEELRLADAGNVVLKGAAWPEVSDTLRRALGAILSREARPIVIGGEHIVSFPAVEECLKRYPDLVVVQMDAHLDLRDEYGGERFSHATVMRRIFEKIGSGRLIQFGIRSGTREEWALAERERTLVKACGALPSIVGRRPVYLTVDLDVLDPSVMPETGTPEPGGLTFNDLYGAFLSLKGLNIVGCDVVEYCPPPGGGGPSGAVAAKVIRELIFLIASGNKLPGPTSKV